VAAGPTSVLPRAEQVRLAAPLPRCGSASRVVVIAGLAIVLEMDHRSDGWARKRESWAVNFQLSKEDVAQTRRTGKWL
jgi:hypothetical protein